MIQRNGKHIRDQRPWFYYNLLKIFKELSKSLFCRSVLYYIDASVFILFYNIYFKRFQIIIWDCFVGTLSANFEECKSYLIDISILGSKNSNKILTVLRRFVEYIWDKSFE